MKNKNENIFPDIMGNILGTSRMKVICTDCQLKYKRVPLVTNDLGFKMCRHITHTQYPNGMNVWQ